MENITNRVSGNFNFREMEKGQFFYFQLNGTTAAFLLNDENEYYFVHALDDRLDGASGGARYWARNRDSDMPALTSSWHLDFTPDEDTVSSLLEAWKSRVSDRIDTIGLIAGACTSRRTARPTRRASAQSEFYLRNYTQDNIYTGFHSYHDSHRSGFYNKPKNDKEGYKCGVELEIVATSSMNRNKINNYKSNWFTQESDASLDSNGIELVTIPLLPKDAKDRRTWTPLCEALSPIAQSWNRTCCGLHVHIGREILGSTAEQKSETLGKLLFLYHHYLKDWSTNVSIYGRSRAYHDNDGKTEEGKAAMLLGSSVFRDKKVVAKVDKAMKDRSGRDRYFDINISNRNTIEFRKGKGSINVDRIIGIIEYSEKMCLYAKQAKWTEISLDDFVRWMNIHVSKTSPLYRYFTREKNETR